MGRFGTDVMALACIAGGALVGSGVTAGLVARADGSPQHRVHVSCDASVSSQVMIRLGEGDTSRENVRIIATRPCGEPVEVDVDQLRERLEVARVRMERARRSAEVARVQADEVRLRAERLRISVEEMGSPADEVEAAEQVLEAATTARLEAMERQLQAAVVRLNELGADDTALREALERLRLERARVVRITESGGN